MTTIQMYDQAAAETRTFALEMDGCAATYRDLDEEREIADLEDRYYEEMAAEHYAAEAAAQAGGGAEATHRAALRAGERMDSSGQTAKLIAETERFMRRATRPNRRHAQERAPRGIPLSDTEAIADLAWVLAPYPAQRPATLSVREMQRREREAESARRQRELDIREANEAYAFEWHARHG